MPTEPRQQLRLAAIVLAIVVALLAAAYFVFFRTPMVPAYQNVRQGDASAIVAQLAKSGIAYRLANDGHDVLVPEDRVAEARVAVAGANVAMGGTVGFELFNDSDMGLTEFAQKINFQRAMQGELARTIMMTQGVEFARVHLALPERSIFRANQGAPSAAVTVQMAPNRVLTRQRIEGIRQLIASSVPGLSQGAVAVLDENGDLVTPVAGPDNSYGAPLDERSALDSYYRIRAKEAIALIDPALKFDVTISTQPQAGLAPVGETTDAARGLPSRSQVVMSVQVRTETTLTAEQQGRIGAALVDSLQLRREGGDVLRFVTGAVRADIPLAPAVPSVPAAEPTRVTADPPLPTEEGFAFAWWMLAIGAGLIALLLLLLRPRRRLDDAEALSFAEQLKSAAPAQGSLDVG